MWGCTDVVKYLCEEVKCNIDCTTDAGETPLHKACRNGHTDVVKYLCEETKCNINCASNSLRTPLHYACVWGHLECVKVLSEHKANPECTDEDGRTPLHFTCQYGHKDFVHYLLSEMHCNVNATDRYGSSPLSLTTNSDVIRELIRYGASVKDVYVQYGCELPTSYQKQPAKSVVKTFVVGDPEAGKTTLVKALETESLGLFRFTRRFVKVSGIDQKTAGIIPHSIDSQQFGHITVYDFAGHKEFYGSHAAMLRNTMAGSTAALFLLLADLRKDEEEFKQSILFWLSLIDNQCPSVDPKPHIIVVGSHADQVKSKVEISIKDSTVHSLVRTSAFANLNFAGFFSVNCCYSESSGISELRQCVAESCDALRNNAEMGFNCHCLLLYLLDNFQDVPALPIKALQMRSAQLPADSAAKIILRFIPEDSHTLYELCTNLNERGNILLLKSPHKLEESWIVLDQDLLLSRVTGTVFAPEGFKQHRNISNSTGVVPLSQLKGYFPEVDVNMLAQFLFHLEFCQEITDGEVLRLLHNPQQIEPQERFFFFPTLVSITVPDGVWRADSSFSYHSGWMLQCSQAEQFFMPRFLQVLILRLAFSFALASDAEVPSRNLPALQRKCTVWKNGISWASRSGVEALVEVAAQSKRVNVILRCWNGREVACSHLRSAIIQKVHSATGEFCPNVPTSEWFVDPSDVIQYPLKHMEEASLVSYSELAKAIVATEPGVLNTAGRPVNLQGLLYFEPYLHFGERILHKLFDDQDYSKQLVSDEFLCLFANRVHSSTDNFIKLLNNPQTTLLHECISQAPSGSSTDELVRILKLWRDASEGTYRCLRDELDKFSVFAGRNPLVVTGCSVKPPMSGTHSGLPVAAPKKWFSDEVDETLLDIQALFDVNSELVAVAPKWKDVGLSLGLSSSMLESIGANFQDVNHCLTEMLSAWLQKQDRTVPTWRSLANALESPSVNRIDLAERIGTSHGKTVLKPSELNMKYQDVSSEQIDYDTGLQDVIQEVSTIHNWFPLGLALGLSYDSLKRIERDHSQDNYHCLVETLTAWLQKRDMVARRGGPNWRALAQGLDTPLVGRTDVASMIAVEHKTQLANF